MKKVTFISLFVLTHLFFIFFQINKHNQIIKLSYKKQKYENEIKELTQKKQELAQNWYHMRKRSAIKEFAEENLEMSKLELKNIRKLNKEQNG